METNFLDAASIQKRYTTQRALKNGVSVNFRPIECSDQSKFKDFFKSLSPKSIHYRFFEIIKELPNETVEKYCDIDYNQEMAIIAQPVGDGKIVGVARLEVDRAKRRGEFALVIADVWQGLGLGSELLAFVVAVARDYGLVEIHCFVSGDNERMIALAERAGFGVKSSDGDILEMTLPLT